MDEQGINATMLAEMSGVSVPTVTQVLNRKKFEGVQAATVMRYARALGVRTAYLLEGELPKHFGVAPTVVQDGDALAASIAEKLFARFRDEPSSSQVTHDEPSRPDDRQSRPPRR